MVHTFGGTRDDLVRALALAEAGRVSTHTEAYELEDAPRALDGPRRGEGPREGRARPVTRGRGLARSRRFEVTSVQMDAAINSAPEMASVW